MLDIKENILHVVNVFFIPFIPQRFDNATYLYLLTDARLRLIGFLVTFNTCERTWLLKSVFYSVHDFCTKGVTIVC